MSHSAVDYCTASIDLCVLLEQRPETIHGFEPPTYFSSYAGVYGMVTRIGGTVYVVFQGSDGAKDWILDISAFPLVYSKKISDIFPWNWFRTRPRVHGGFREGYYSIRGTVIRILQEYGIDNSTNLIITGHSYGAALATLAAMDIHKQFKIEPSAVFLFASPRVGNKKFRDQFNRKIRNCTNIAYQPDPVPHLPPSCLGYAHVGRIIYVVDHQESPGVFNITGTVDRYLSAHNIYRYQRLTRSNVYYMRSEPLV